MIVNLSASGEKSYRSVLMYVFILYKCERAIRRSVHLLRQGRALC